jgi:DNA-binding LytR/AlgR family response regulator
MIHRFVLFNKTHVSELRRLVKLASPDLIVARSYPRPSMEILKRVKGTFGITRELVYKMTSHEVLLVDSEQKTLTICTSHDHEQVFQGDVDETMYVLDDD